MSNNRDEIISKMEELRVKAESLCVEYNDASAAIENPTEAAEPPRALSAIAADLDEIVTDYNVASRKLCYTDCQQSGDPLREAVIRLTYPTITYRDEPVDKENKDITVRKIVDRAKEIDLLDLDARLKGIGNDKMWAHRVKFLNCLLSIRTAKDLGCDEICHKDGAVNLKVFKDNFNYSDIAKKMGEHKTDSRAANPVSNKQMLKTLREMVSMMLGDEIGNTAASCDVNFLSMIYVSSGRKAMQVVVPTNKKFVWYMMEVCHRLVTGEHYTVFSKEYKAK